VLRVLVLTVLVLTVLVLTVLVLPAPHDQWPGLCRCA
jgi:hypothetical protein